MSHVDFCLKYVFGIDCIPEDNTTDALCFDNICVKKSECTLNATASNANEHANDILIKVCTFLLNLT